MGAFQGDTGSGAEVDEVIEKMDWHDIDVEKALPADLASAIKEAVAFMKKAAGEEGAPADALKRVAAFLSKVAGGKYPYPKPAGKTDGDGDGDGKTGDGDTSKQEKCPECGAQMKDGVCPECGYKAKAKTQKSEGLTVTVLPDGQVQVSGEPVEKGGKQFTAERIAGVGAIAKQAMSLLAETDPDTAKAIIAELVKATLPADLKWTQGTHAVPASVKKEDIEAAVKAAVEPITKKVDDIGNKVEDITKTRGEPKSGDGDDAADQEPTQKSENFWKDLPL